MKIFVATAATQGHRPSDLNGCIEGELVELASACESGEVNPYGTCPSGRVFRGLASEGFTTTARVQDVPWLTPVRLADVLCMTRGVGSDDSSPHRLSEVWAATTTIVQEASRFAVDQIVERRGWTVQPRKKTRAAIKK